MAYTANGVDFDGTNDYLLRGADLTGTTDTKVGTLSFWFRFDSLVSSVARILHAGPSSGSKGVFSFGRRNNGRIFIDGLQIGDTSSTLKLETKTDLTTGAWHHLIAAWDVSGAGKGHIFVDDVDDEDTGLTILVDRNLDYTHQNWAIASDVFAGFKYPGCLADLWFDENYLDVSVEANRRKFIDGSGNVVDLGSDGSAPTGTAPIIFMSGVTSSWHTNDGTGGGFTEVGAIADCSDDPPAAAADPVVAGPPKHEGLLRNVGRFMN